MVKYISVLIIFCLCLVSGIKNTLYADTEEEKKLLMQEHLEKVKNTYPEKYEARIKEGGNTNDCLSCHKDVFKEKKTSGPGGRGFPR